MYRRANRLDSLDSWRRGELHQHRPDAVELRTPPDGTYPGILGSLLTVGFPVVLSTQVTIPDQRRCSTSTKRLKKMQAAQIDSKGNQRVDMEAQVD